MSLTASSLIRAGRRLAFGATGRQKVSDATLLEELNHQDLLVMQMLSQTAPDLLATVTGTATIVLAKNQTGGYTLSTAMAYRDFVHVDSTNNTYTPISVIQRQYQDEYTLRHPAIMLNTLSAAGVAFPVDPQGERWQSSGSRNWFEVTSGHKFEYSYIPTQSILTTLTNTMGSPDFARQIFVSALELRIITMNPDAPDVRIQAASGRYIQAMESVRWQAMKFVSPQGSRGVGSRGGVSETYWVNSQVGG